MKILYQLPSLTSIYAGRTIHNGYRNAFRELGHELRFLTADDDMKKAVQSFRPDALITATHFYYQRFIDNEYLNECRREGLFVFVWLAPWKSGVSGSRINEAGSLEADRRVRDLIARDRLQGRELCWAE